MTDIEFVPPLSLTGPWRATIPCSLAALQELYRSTECRSLMYRDCQAEREAAALDRLRDPNEMRLVIDKADRNTGIITAHWEMP